MHLLCIHLSVRVVKKDLKGGVLGLLAPASYLEGETANKEIHKRCFLSNFNDIAYNSLNIELDVNKNKSCVVNFRRCPNPQTPF